MSEYRFDDMESITGVAKLEAELVRKNSSYVEGFAPCGMDYVEGF